MIWEKLETGVNQAITRAVDSPRWRQITRVEALAIAANRFGENATWLIESMERNLYGAFQVRENLQIRCRVGKPNA